MGNGSQRYIDYNRKIACLNYSGERRINVLFPPCAGSGVVVSAVHCVHVIYVLNNISFERERVRI